MKIGKLRHRLKVQSPTRYRDANGGWYPLWSTTATRWGSVEPISGQELQNAKQTTSTVTHKVKVRSNVDLVITSSMRLVRGDDLQFLNIISARLVDQIQHYWELDCKENTGDGLGSETPTSEIDVEPLPTATTLGSEDSGKLLTDQGALGAPSTRAITLPDLSTINGDVYYDVLIVDGTGLRFVATNGATIQIGTLVSAANGFIQATDKGANIRIYRIDTNAWACGGPFGGWSVDE